MKLQIRENEGTETLKKGRFDLIQGDRREIDGI